MSYETVNSKEKNQELVINTIIKQFDEYKDQFLSFVKCEYSYEEKKVHTASDIDKALGLSGASPMIDFCSLLAELKNCVVKQALTLTTIKTNVL